ncbi:MAG: acyl-CoA thioester hydrolase/BAAT C-terminal domain-containing protein [Wenzhouxiangella sp.]
MLVSPAFSGASPSPGSDLHPRGAAEASPSFEVSPAQRLHLEDKVIEVRGVLPGSVVVLSANLVDGAGREWSSRASFHADAEGRVSTARQAAVSGTYTGVDAHGLVWSMLPVPLEQLDTVTGLDPDWPTQPRRDGPSLTIRYQALVRVGLGAGDTAVLHAEQEVVFVASGVRRTVIEGESFEGVLFEAPGPGPHPVVMIMTGSSGGMPEDHAEELASRGITVLAIAHFNHPNRPADMISIPLEYFHDAADWLRARTGAPRIGLVGTSRGGEGVLLLASSRPELYGAVVAIVPSNVVWDGCCSPDAFAHPAWTFRGEPIGGVFSALLADPVAFAAAAATIAPEFGFHAGMLNPGAAAIPVEHIEAPILLLSGDSDELWPSTLGAEQIIKRLRENDFPYTAEHIAYPGAGHRAGSGMLVTSLSMRGVHPVDKEVYALGGTPALNAAANRDAIRQQVAFLKAHLPLGIQ